MSEQALSIVGRIALCKSVHEIIFYYLPSYRIHRVHAVRPAWRAGRGNGGGRQSRVSSLELFLFVPRSCDGRQLAVLRARVI
ncbi:hypothetical protein EVAR_46483_1 [Eumeta japonica]|uniref:Uncharacterized protein n=1 Tax=Eumeta variegata TaxID=151549 RepID=A0A4C1WRW0_EUMVA|nr:hypothetical protein EVAR_46483_1 [Eumeta japonica]